MKARIGISRRHFLKGSAAIAIGGSLWTDSLLASINDPMVTAIFTHGVASGEPSANSVLLWTRINPTNKSSSFIVHWELSTDPSFSVILRSGSAQAQQNRDYTVKVKVAKLNAGTTYFYRFLSQGQYSEVGRTKTLPNGDISSLTLAIASCSNFAFGFFNAYEDIARDSSIDFVVHLGDYIYEYGQDGWGGDVSRQINRQHLPAHEIVSIADYRARHSQYKKDKSSRMMHACHPLIPIWDDHESANNPYKNGAQNHQPKSEGEWTLRKQASLQAYFEWMPVYDPIESEEPEAMWREFKFGKLAKMVTLETRHTGRDKQIDYSQYLTELNTATALNNFKTNILNAPNRNMLSKEMEAFYRASFDIEDKDSVWKLVANQIPMARIHVPKTEDFIPVATDTPDDPLLAERKGLAALSKLDLPLYTDTWDGYPVAREHFYDLNLDLGIQDLLVLTGDSHSFWTNQLFNASGEPMGFEIGTSGISSPGDFLAFGKEIAEEMDTRLANHNKEILWTNGRENGYVKLYIEETKAKVDYVTVSTVLSEKYVSKLLKSIVIHKENRKLKII